MAIIALLANLMMMMPLLLLTMTTLLGIYQKFLPLVALTLPHREVTLCEMQEKFIILHSEIYLVRWRVAFALLRP